MPNPLRLAQHSLASAVVIAALSVPATGASAQSLTLPPGIGPVLPPAQQLLVNGGFEDLGSSLNTPWHGWERVNMEVAAGIPLPPPANPHVIAGLGLAGGTLVYDARVGPYCGNNVLATGGTWDGPGGGFTFQEVTIPANAPKPTLSFHLLVDSTVPTRSWNGYKYLPILYPDPDRITVSIMTSTGDAFPGQTLKQLATYTLYDANPAPDNLYPSGWFGTSGWLRKGDFDLSAYRGQTIQVMFNKHSTSGPLTTTNFYVDAVELWTSTPSPVQAISQPC